VLWQYHIASPVQAQRLPDGHTIILSKYGRIFEMDGARKIVWEYRDAKIVRFSAY
jgi:hypothetical protein